MTEKLTVRRIAPNGNFFCDGGAELLTETASRGMRSRGVRIRTGTRAGTGC
nr:MAG TPA_asm: hypothetical protein [Caudoviricetes sp.]